MFRVRGLSNADVMGDPCDPITVQFGALPTTSISGISSYPNPFDSRSGRATIVYTLDAAHEVTIKIFNVFGGKVKQLEFGAGSTGGQPGTNQVFWDGTDDSGSKVSKGIYLAVVSAGGAKATYKIGVIH